MNTYEDAVTIHRDAHGRVTESHDGAILEIILYCPCGGSEWKCCYGKGYWRLTIEAGNNWEEVERMARRSRGKPQELAKYALAFLQAAQ